MDKRITTSLSTFGKNYFRVLSHPQVRKLFVASLFSNLELASYFAAIQIVVYSLIPNTFLLGVVTSMAAISSLFAPYTGYIVDYHNKKNLILIVRVANIFVFAVLAVVVAIRFPYFYLIFVAIALAIQINNLIRGQSLGPVYRSFLKDNETAVSYRSVQETFYWATFAIMPVTIGLIITFYGDFIPFILIAAFVVPQVFLYSRIKFEEPTIKGNKPLHFFSSMKESFGVLRSLTRKNPAYALFVFLPLIHSFFTTANSVLIVALIYKLHNFALSYGIIVSVGIAGNAVGSFLAGILKIKKVSVITFLFMLTFLLDVPVGIDPTFWIMIIFLTLGGTMYFIISTEFRGIEIILFPKEHYGRIQGIIGFLRGISTLTGTLVISAVALIFPVRYVYLFSVVALSVLTAMFLFNKKFRGSDLDYSV